MLYANWSASWVPLAMFKPEWDQMIAVAPDGTGYTAAADPFLYPIWEKLGEIGGG